MNYLLANELFLTSWNPYYWKLQLNPLARDRLHMIYACSVITRMSKLKVKQR